jgi:hypothetical protein
LIQDYVDSNWADLIWIWEIFGFHFLSISIKEMDKFPLEYVEPRENYEFTKEITKRWAIELKIYYFEKEVLIN